MMGKAKVLSRSYTLYKDKGTWLGQVVLTNDGFFACVTDYGNHSYAWRSTGHEDFREFIIRLDVHYFASKMASGLNYTVYPTKKIISSIDQFAEKILPALQEVLKSEIENGIGWSDL